MKENSWYKEYSYCTFCEKRLPVVTMRCPDCNHKVRHRRRGTNEISYKERKERGYLVVGVPPIRDVKFKRSESHI